MRVEEVAAELGVSASYAYSVIRRLNDERKARIKHLSGELKQAQKDLEYCAEISERSGQVHYNLIDLIRDNQTPAHENRMQSRNSTERQ